MSLLIWYKHWLLPLLFWLNNKLTHEHFCQQLWPATLLPKNICFVFYSLLQNVGFVSFAILRLHCRQYCLVRLPDYSSSEWKDMGRKQWQYWGNNNLGDCLEVHECLFVLEQRHNWSCFIKIPVLSGVHITNRLGHKELIVELLILLISLIFMSAKYYFMAVWYWDIGKWGGPVNSFF